MDYRELELAGVDMSDLMIRLMNNEKLIGLFIGKFLQDKTYASLLASVEEGDMAAAERAAHTLKGISGNLSLKRLFELSREQLSLFRAGEPEKAVALMGDMAEAYDTAVTHMTVWLQK